MVSINKRGTSKTKRIEEVNLEEEVSCSTTRDNAFDNALRFKGNQGDVKTILFKTLE